jgi:hypothetical protein
LLCSLPFDKGPAAEIPVRVVDVLKMVSNQRLLLRGWLGGADIHKAVNLPGISRDNFRVNFLRDFQGAAGLSRTRRPDK